MKTKKILFLHPFPAIKENFFFARHGHLGINHGLGILAQMARMKKHKVKIVAYSTISELAKHLNVSYDWIFITTYTNQIPLILKSLKIISKKIPSSSVFLGGSHATFAPNDFNNYPYDLLVRGEGEMFMHKLLEGEDFETLPGVFRKDETITKEFVPLIHNLDTLPFAYRYLTPRQCSYRLEILGLRGCLFKCSYCVGDQYNKIYENHLRRRSPGNIIDEIKSIKGKYWVVRFADSNLFGDRNWLEELFKLYKKNINLRFSINIRPSLVNKDILRMIKKAGGIMLQIGIEHGDYTTRKELMMRNETDEQIIESFKLAKSMGFQTMSFNVFGFPDDTEEDIIKLIELNKKVKPDYIYYSLFQPYPGTTLATYAKKKRIKYKFGNSYFRWNAKQIDTLPQLPGISRERLGYYFQNFPRMIRRKPLYQKIIDITGEGIFARQVVKK